MEPQRPEPTLDESIRQVMHTLPPPIRRYLGSGKYSEVASHLMQKYALHIDQGGILEREIMLLLMGIENPDEFTQTLAEEAQLSPEIINNVTRDVNEQIFVPLREQMRREDTQPKQVPSPARPVASVPSYHPPVSARPAPPPGAPRPLNNPQSGLSGDHFAKQNDLVKPPAKPDAPFSTSWDKWPSSTPKQEAWSPQSAVFIPANPQLPTHPPETFTTKITPAPRPPLNRPAPGAGRSGEPPKAVLAQRPPASRAAVTDSGRLLEDHEEPHIEFADTPPAPRPPAPRSPAGNTPANLPGAYGGRPSVSSAPRPVAPKPPAAPYSVDPYREPIDEN